MIDIARKVAGDVARAFREGADIHRRTAAEVFGVTEALVSGDMRRTAKVDTELGGQKLRKGDKLLLYYPSANRDEAAFENPDRFDIGRRNNHHLAFGVGEHFCIGTHLARLETRVMFEEILARLDGLELAGDVSLLRSNLIDGIKHMPLRFRAASA